MTAPNTTPGPWRWEVSHTSKQVQLCGGARPKYDLTVMGFRRWGMGGAAPTFIDGRLIMHRADELTAVVPGREHHASWFQTIDHPDAHLIAAAPDMYDALEAVVRTMDGYRSQMKFCDIEALGYFREFDRRIEASGLRAALAKARGEA